MAVSAAAMRSATARKSLWEKPRAASAGVPIRRPEVIIGGRGSKGTALRLTVMSTAANRSSACWPSSSASRRSTRTRCTSVPPVSTAMPRSATSGWVNRPARMRAPSRQRCWRCANSGCAAILNAVALAAMTCSSGPPCCPGKTAELIFLAMAGSLHKMMPPRGPPSVL
ncbi:Uncharacterised protein [Mycobacterium tuberculosis]|nr:Uncharacterised protein [Mycobacterium tuberculosis]